MTLQNIQSNEEIFTIDVVFIEQWKRSISVEQNKYPKAKKIKRKLSGNQVIGQWFINGNLKDEIYWNMLEKMLYFKAVKGQGPDSP